MTSDESALIAEAQEYAERQLTGPSLRIVDRLIAALEHAMVELAGPESEWEWGWRQGDEGHAWLVSESDARAFVASAEAKRAQRRLETQDPTWNFSDMPEVVRRRPAGPWEAV